MERSLCKAVLERSLCKAGFSSTRTLPAKLRQLITGQRTRQRSREHEFESGKVHEFDLGLKVTKIDPSQSLTG